MSEQRKAVGSIGNERKAAALPHRAILRVTGEDARDFLDKLITADMARVTLNQSIHSALLTPQGKIISDFFVVSAEEADGGGYYLDVPLVAAADLIKRLTLYKLRAKVTIEDQSAELGVFAIWGDDLSKTDIAFCTPDPRLQELGLRIIAHKSQFAAISEAFGVSPGLDSEQAVLAYHRHRASHGIGEAAFDYILGDTFPHEINMDQLGGIDFKKGCYVGQEVVSRMQYRGTARTRLVPLVTQNGFSVAENISVLAGDKAIGFTGTGSDGLNLGMIRLDKAIQALEEGVTLTAGAVEVKPRKPAWWSANWPIAEA